MSQGSEEDGNVLLAEHGVAHLMEAVVAVAVAAVPEVAQASVSVLAGGHQWAETVASSAPSIQELDGRQYQSERGPSVEVLRAGDEMRSRLPDDRWPEFSSAAAGMGLTSAWSLPVIVEDEISGALNLYSKGEPVWTGESASVARLLADRTGVLLANAMALTRVQMANSTLKRALETRTVIGQAQGVLIARQGIGADESFDILRRASQRTNRKLREVAAEIVASALSGAARPSAEEASAPGAGDGPSPF